MYYAKGQSLVLSQTARRINHSVNPYYSKDLSGAKLDYAMDQLYALY